MLSPDRPTSFVIPYDRLEALKREFHESSGGATRDDLINVILILQDIVGTLHINELNSRAGATW